jgi:uncharacterized repeat protein (TIGR01451 family)
LVGYNALDGVVPGCFNFDFVVTLKVKVAKSEVSFQKFVRKAGDTSGKLTELGGLKAGDKVEWLLVYKNGTDQTITNAFIRDQLPAHVKLVPGTVKQYDSNFPNGFQRTDEGIFTGTGISIGNVGPGANGSIRFQTTVSDDLKCGDNPMTNNAWFRSDQTSEQGSSAVIKADKVCTTTVTPPTTPNTPAPELPQTGAEGAAAGALGTGAVGYSLRAYLRSKRSLLDALKR